MGNLASRQRLRPPSFSRHWHRHTLLGLVDLDLLEGARDPGQCGSQLVLGGLLRVMLGPAGARVAFLMNCRGDYCIKYRVTIYRHWEGDLFIYLVRTILAWPGACSQ